MTNPFNPRRTRKDILARNSNVICIGYCELQTLLRYRGVLAGHTEGVYGWYADCYYVGYPDTIIVTGYRPFGNIKPDYDTVRAYEKRCKEAVKNCRTWEECKVAAGEVMDAFITEVTR